MQTTIARAPAAGRNWESFGGDPFLAGVASVESVEGIQSQGVIANIKHFIANEQVRFGLLPCLVHFDHDLHAAPFHHRIGTLPLLCKLEHRRQNPA